MKQLFSLPGSTLRASVSQNHNHRSADNEHQSYDPKPRSKSLTKFHVRCIYTTHYIYNESIPCCLFLQDAIRDFAFRLMKRSAAEGLPPWKAPIFTAPRERVKAFVRGDRTRGPSQDDFLIDFNDTPGCAWNQTAVAVFTRAFMEDEHNIYTNRNQVSTTFTRHLRTLYNQFHDYMAIQANGGVDLGPPNAAQNARIQRRRAVGFPFAPLSILFNVGV